MTATPAGIENENPYPGLRPFREDEEHLYFGREHQVDSLVSKLSNKKFLAVVGTSGSGKSSLVNCGVRPSLYRGLMSSAGSAWKIAQFRPGRRPIQALAQAIAAAGILRPAGEASAPFDNVIETYLRVTNRGVINIVKKAQLPERTNVLIVADQFEEIFRFRERDAGAEEATAFVNLLLAAAQSEERIYVVLTMRSDFLGDCAQFHGLPEAINEGQFLVPRLTRDERRSAIAGPIAVTGGELDPALLTRLVNDVGDDPDQLSILQHALNRTWARWQSQKADRPIMLDDYEAIGSMVGALHQHAEKAFGEVEQEGLARVCERMFKTLTDTSTDPRGIRRPMEFGALCAIADAKPDEMERVIAAFRKPSRSFVMPPFPEPLAPGTIVDISHESFMRVWQRLKSWAADESQSAVMYRRISETANLHSANKARLWGDPELQLGLEWLEKQAPTAAWADLYGGNLPGVLDFLEKSRQARIRDVAEMEFERRWAAVSAPVGLTVGVVLALAAYKKLSVLTRGNPYLDLIALTLPVALILAFSVLLNRYGKMTLYRMTIDRIVKRISQAPESPARAESARVGNLLDLPVLRDPFASYGWRLLGFSIDAFMFFFLLGVCGALLKESMVTYAICLPAWFFYQTLTMRSKRQATLGMRVVRVYVADLNGNVISWKKATIRHFARLLTIYSVVGPFMPLWTKRHQTLHDLIAGTVVLRHAKS
jgi:energy-coupling factor transporter ATP-binding protein EcfA2